MKDFIKENWYWIGIIIVLISALLSKCSNENVKKKDVPNYQTVSTKKEAITVAQLPESIVKKFKEIKTVTRYVDRLRVDTVKVVYVDSVPCVYSKIGELKTKEYSFNYLSNQKGITIDNFAINDSLLIVTGTKRKWFLGKETNTIEISHSNKFINSDSVMHLEVVKPKKFYDTNLFKLGVGFIAGSLIMK